MRAIHRYINVRKMLHCILDTRRTKKRHTEGVSSLKLPTQCYDVMSEMF
jgi:hypothetical protein